MYFFFLLFVFLQSVYLLNNSCAGFRMMFSFIKASLPVNQLEKNNFERAEHINECQMNKIIQKNKTIFFCHTHFLMLTRKVHYKSLKNVVSTIENVTTILVHLLDFFFNHLRCLDLQNVKMGN